MLVGTANPLEGRFLSARPPGLSALRVVTPAAIFAAASIGYLFVKRLPLRLDLVFRQVTSDCG